jgi:hypothetical protein
MCDSLTACSVWDLLCRCSAGKDRSHLGFLSTESALTATVPFQVLLSLEMVAIFRYGIDIDGSFEDKKLQVDSLKL